MKLISCDGCGSVYAADKMPWPEPEYEMDDKDEWEVQTNEDKFTWYDGQSRAIIICSCGDELYEPDK